MFEILRTFAPHLPRSSSPVRTPLFQGGNRGSNPLRGTARPFRQTYLVASERVLTMSGPS